MNFTPSWIGLNPAQSATSGTALYPALPSWFWTYDTLGQVTSADSSVATTVNGVTTVNLYDGNGNVSAPGELHRLSQ